MYAGHGDGRRQVYWFLSRNGCQPSSHHCRIPPPSSWLLLLLLLLPERGVARFHIRGRSAALPAEELLVQFAGALGLGENRPHPPRLDLGSVAVSVVSRESRDGGRVHRRRREVAGTARREFHRRGGGT